MDTLSSVEDESSLNSDCPLCKGAGIVHPLLPSGKPDFSQVEPCSCTRKELTEPHQNRLRKYSNLGSLSRFTFDNLEPQGRSGDPKSQEKFAYVYDAARAFAAEPKGWFIISGPSGSGKTHLVAAIVNERISQGFPAFYMTTPDLLDHLRSAFGSGSEMPYDELFDQVRNAPLLVLDDLGVQTSTPWAKEKLDQLLTYRFNGELPTVIVTTLPVEQLDDRLFTRLTDSKLCHIYEVEEKRDALEYGWGPEFELQKSMTFANFKSRANLTPEQQENLEGAYQLAFEFAKSLPREWLVFMGVPGCGKTHLAAAIVNYRYQANQPALFVVVPEFLDHLRSTFNPESKVSYDQLFEKVKKSPLLVLDDFGEQSTTPWAKEKLYQVLNYRYNARLATVITSRFSLDELEGSGSPVTSRFSDVKISTPFNIIAPDNRSDLRSNPQKAPRRDRRGR